MHFHFRITQQIFTCPKSTLKSLEEDLKLFYVNNKDTRTTLVTSFWSLYCLLWSYFTSFSSASIVEFVCWEKGKKYCWFQISDDFSKPKFVMVFLKSHYRSVYIKILAWVKDNRTLFGNSLFQYPVKKVTVSFI